MGAQGWVLGSQAAIEPWFSCAAQHCIHPSRAMWGQAGARASSLRTRMEPAQPRAGCSLYGHPCRVVEQGQARVAHLPSPTHPDRLCRSSLGTASPPWYPPLLPLRPVLGGLLAPTAGWHAVYLLLLGGLSRANAGAALAPARLKRLREVLGCHLLSQLVPPGNSLLQDTGFGKSNPRACRSCTAPHRARAHRESLAEPSRRQSHVSGPLLANTGLQP